jgi:hypothetical protein
MHNCVRRLFMVVELYLALSSIDLNRAWTEAKDLFTVTFNFSFQS